MIPLAPLLSPLLSAAKAIPPWAWVVGVALIYGGCQHQRAKSAGETLRKAEAAAAAEEARALRESITETERRVSAHQEIASAAQSKAQANARAAAAARADADRVRLAAAALAASAGAHDPAAAGDCSAAVGAGRLLADLLGRAVTRAAELADHADQARAAGKACEAAYDALTTPKGHP